MSIARIGDLIAALRRSGLLEAGQMAEVQSTIQTRFPDPRGLARELVRRGWLTTFQVNELFHDRGEDLVLGQYVLLERLGAGGMGQVFKARQRRLQRVVALKVIRKDLLAHSDAVQRFRVEALAAARLAHPNIVTIFDADEVNGRHFLVMEHVEGTDLARLVEERGPLSAGLACHCVRQAALGLQHAFERGIVHRDIKPSNLLLTGSTVKILDMGLARLHDLTEAGAAAGRLTPTGAVMGTPDFLAPEQARDAHAVDVRADIYSLGCTLFYLLAGHVPFPGGSAVEKLLKHQVEEPPWQQLPPSVPQPVLAVLRRSLAKQPADRYQTPAEMATALEPFASVEACATLAASRRATGAEASAGPRTPTVSAPSLGNRNLAGSSHLEDRPAASTLPPRPAIRGSRRRTWAFVVAAGSVLLVAVAVGFLLWSGLSWPGAEHSKVPVVPVVPRQWREGSTLQGNGAVLGLAFSPDSRLLAAACGNTDQPREPGEVKVWDVNTGKEAATLGEHAAEAKCVAFAADGKVLASGTGDWNHQVSGKVKLWDVSELDGQVHFHERASFAAHEGGVYSVAFQPGGKALATAGYDRTVKLWDLAGKWLADLEGHSGKVNAVAFSHDGKLLASGSEDGTVKLWDVAARKELATLPGLKGGWILGVAMSHDDGMVAAVTGVPEGQAAQVRLWDVPARRVIAFRDHGIRHVLCIAFAPDGKTVATGCTERFGRVWDVATGTQLDTLEYHTGPVWSVAFSPDGRLLATGSADRTVKLWKGRDQ